MDQVILWLQSLDRPFAFLVALPFVVIAAAWVGDLVRQRFRNNQRQSPRDM